MSQPNKNCLFNPPLPTYHHIWQSFMHLDSNIVREDIFDVAFLTEADVALLKDDFDVEDKTTVSITPCA